MEKLPYDVKYKEMRDEKIGDYLQKLYYLFPMALVTLLVYITLLSEKIFPDVVNCMFFLKVFVNFIVSRPRVCCKDTVMEYWYAPRNAAHDHVPASPTEARWLQRVLMSGKMRQRLTNCSEAGRARTIFPPSSL
jgi:hypothetical protein